MMSLLVNEVNVNKQESIQSSWFFTNASQSALSGTSQLNRANTIARTGYKTESMKHSLRLKNQNLFLMFCIRHLSEVAEKRRDFVANDKVTPILYAL